MYDYQKDKTISPVGRDRCLRFIDQLDINIDRSLKQLTDEQLEKLGWPTGFDGSKALGHWSDADLGKLCEPLLKAAGEEVFSEVLDKQLLDRHPLAKRAAATLSPAEVKQLVAALRAFEKAGAKVTDESTRQALWTKHAH